MVEELEVKEVVFEGETLKMCDNMLRKKIDPYDFHVGKKLVTRLFIRGIKTYGDLPRDLTELEKNDGETRWTLRYLFKGMRRLDKSIRELIYYDHGSLDNEIVAFDKWLSTKSHLEPCKLDPRYISLYKVKYYESFDERKVTLKVLGEILGVSPQRAGKILKSGDRKLREYTLKHFPRLAQAMEEGCELTTNDKISGDPFYYYLLTKAFKQMK
ncbi:hypothetical protein [Salipaludibacillus sp. CF4.18]|uniref:hypothetical protein n=1 Tax=Salipaludibacillus sp. CF4.18 TaxID=3373081 RepID=UPI003EE7BAA1